MFIKHCKDKNNVQATSSTGKFLNCNQWDTYSTDSSFTVVICRFIIQWEFVMLNRTN